MTVPQLQPPSVLHTLSFHQNRCHQIRGWLGGGTRGVYIAVWYCYASIYSSAWLSLGTVSLRLDRQRYGFAASNPPAPPALCCAGSSSPRSFMQQNQVTDVVPQFRPSWRASSNRYRTYSRTPAVPRPVGGATRDCAVIECSLMGLVRKERNHLAR
jgi:hypothetical protein